VDGVVFEESGLQRYDAAVSQAITNVSVKPAGNGGSSAPQHCSVTWETISVAA